MDGRRPTIDRLDTIIGGGHPFPTVPVLSALCGLVVGVNRVVDVIGAIDDPTSFRLILRWSITILWSSIFSVLAVQILVDLGPEIAKPLLTFASSKTGWINNGVALCLLQLGMTLNPTSSSAYKVVSERSCKALCNVAVTMAVLILFQIGRAADVACKAHATVRSFSADAAEELRRLLALSRPAPIIWTINAADVQIPTTNLWARLDATALDQAQDMLVKSSELFAHLDQYHQIEAIKLIARDMINFKDSVGHVYAPRQAFYIAAQVLDTQMNKNLDHFERYPRLWISRLSSVKRAKETRILAVLIFWVFMIVCGTPNMEEPHSVLQRNKDTEHDFSEEAIESLTLTKKSEESKSHTPVVRRIASFDSGYGSSPR